MENVEIKKEESKTIKKEEKKAARRMSVDEKRIFNMTKEQKATLVEFMELRNEARATNQLPIAYKEEEIAKYR